MIYSSITIPRWLQGGIVPNDRGAVLRKFIYGGDTETFRGEPITFQFYSEHAECDEIIWLDDAERATEKFMKWCAERSSKAQHVVYVHNLEFDLVSFFWDKKALLVTTESGEFEFTHKGWKIAGVYGAPTFVRITDASQHKTIIVVDSYSYYRASLAKAADVFCPGLPKLQRPEGLGEKRFSRSDSVFVDYAMRDAVIAYFIGLALEDLHQEFDLSQTVSVADMAARIFRHHYLEKPIPQPTRSIMECGLNSYHGGKNNLAVEPGWYRDVSSLDISSAYPDAMASFPSFYEAKLYKKIRSLNGAAEVPDLGVYKVRGYVKDCSWPCLFAHDFTPIRGEQVPGICVAGYELNEAIRSGEFTPTSIIGWYYDRERDLNSPPLVRFVNEFYARKEAEKDKGKRSMYKFILNSISGKFIQTRKREKLTLVDLDTGSISDTSDLVAGGMFHPFIASCITAHTRAKIHRLEHKYKALHTATDGIFTQQPIRMKAQSGLGAVVNEAHGDLLLLRNKLYVLYGEGDAPGMSEVFPGRHIIKAALHGFAGTTGDLERLVVTNTRQYSAKKVNRLRSSLKSGRTPNEFRDQAYTLKVGGLPVHF